MVKHFVDKNFGISSLSCAQTFILIILIITILSLVSLIYGTTLNKKEDGIFIKNGTDEFRAVKYMELNRKQLVEKYDLEYVITGNFCSDYPSGYIGDITPNSFTLRCCELNWTCNSFIVVNKRLKEIQIK